MTSPTCTSADNEHTGSYPLKSINCLPVELFTFIFSHVIRSSESKHVDSQFRLAGVCRYWRRVIFQNSDFWKIVRFCSHERSIEKIDRVTRASGSKELVVFGPGCHDIDFGTGTNTNTTQIQLLFHDFLLREHIRIEELSLGDYEHDVEGLPGSVLNNIQVLSMTEASLPVKMLAGAPHLRVLQLVIHSNNLYDISAHIPRHITKLRLCLTNDGGILRLIPELKMLEHLSMVHTKRSRPSARFVTISSSGSRSVDISHAPALRRLEIITERRHYMGNMLLNVMDLSKFTHLYIGYISNPNSVDSIDGCIRATAGLGNINCCLTDEHTCCKCCRDLSWTIWPSSWSNFPQCSDSNPSVEPSIHLHNFGSHMLTSSHIGLPCQLVAEMTSLNTLVLCLPPTSSPSSNSSPIPQHMSFYGQFRTVLTLFELFEVIMKSRTLRNLTIRAVDNVEVVQVLTECFTESSNDSCPLLESITYELGSFHGDRYGFWEVWIKFLTLKRSTGRPLKLLRLVGCPNPSEEIMSKIDRSFLETDIVWT